MRGRVVSLPSDLANIRIVVMVELKKAAPPRRVPRALPPPNLTLRPSDERWTSPDPWAVPANRTNLGARLCSRGGRGRA